MHATLETHAPNIETQDSITLGYSRETLAGLYAVMQHADTEETYICNAIKVTDTYILATDRYTVGCWTHGPIPETQVGPVMPTNASGSTLIPRKTVEWITKQSSTVLTGDSHSLKRYSHSLKRYSDTPRTAGSLDGAQAVIAITPGNVRILHYGRVIAETVFDTPTGNYPPMERLFAEPAADSSIGRSGVSFPPKRLERFTRGARKFDRDEIMTVQPTGTSELYKSPLLVTFDGGRFTGLLQPTMFR